MELKIVNSCKGTIDEKNSSSDGSRVFLDNHYIWYCFYKI